MSETVLDRLVARCPRRAGVQPERARGAGRAAVARRGRAVGAGHRPDRRAPAGRVARRVRPDGAARARRTGCAASSPGRSTPSFPTGTPIVYLPGVSRSALRAVDTCPPELAPIAELQYRSQWFSHPNNRDWTVRALLVAPRARPRPASRRRRRHERGAAAGARPAARRADRPAGEAGARRRLLPRARQPRSGPQPARLARRPAGLPRRLDDAQWTAFVQQCKADYGFDPTRRRRGDRRRASSAAARAPGRRSGSGSPRRPSATPASPSSSARPGPTSSSSRTSTPGRRTTRWPRTSSAIGCATSRRSRRRAPATKSPGSKTSTRWRRSTVWADLDQAPLAFALEQLVALAELTTQPLACDDLDSLTSPTTPSGAGGPTTPCCAHSPPPRRSSRSRGGVGGCRRRCTGHGSTPAPRRSRQAIGPMANAHTYEPGPPASTAPGTVTVFVDGLRLDVAHRVQERLDERRPRRRRATTSLAALPTVTQTAKPALVPVGDGSARRRARPARRRTPPPARRRRSRCCAALMADNGVQVLGPTETGDPSGTAWAEAGEIDHRGHDVGIRLVDHLDEEVDRIVGRIRELLDAGWQRVDVVTDHGWLLLPGGMEKVELPPATTEVKKGRCARLKDGAVVDVPTVPWFWDPDVRIALAPGRHLLRGEQGVRARRREPAGVHRPAAHRHRRSATGRRPAARRSPR